MAVLKDLIVHGPSRFLNGINTESMEANTIKASTGIFNQLIATTLEAKNAHIDELTANNATVFGVMDVKGKLQTNQWEAASIANVGGNFYISPTGKSSTGTVTITRTSAATSSAAAKYSVTMAGTFGVSSTSSTIWAAGAYGMATGNVSVGTKKYPLGTCDGPLSNISTGTNTITGFTISNIESAALDIIFDENPSLISSNAISGKSGSDLQVSVYLGKSGNNYMPIGILLTSYGKDNKQYIDIYDGTHSAGTSITGFADPVVRIGDLSGISPYVQSGKYTITPQGWGIYTTQGYFRGEIYSEIGYIGGWTIDGSSIKTNNKASISDNTSGMRIDSANGIGFSGVTYFNKNGTGKVGPWDLSTTYIRNGNIGNATNTSVAGVYLGTDGLNISNGTAATTAYITKTAVNIGNKLTWNGSTLSVTGNVTATSGTIGKWTIFNRGLYSQQVISKETPASIIVTYEPVYADEPLTLNSATPSSGNIETEYSRNGGDTTGDRAEFEYLHYSDVEILETTVLDDNGVEHLEYVYYPLENNERIYDIVDVTEIRTESDSTVVYDNIPAYTGLFNSGEVGISVSMSSDPSSIDDTYDDDEIEAISKTGLFRVHNSGSVVSTEYRVVAGYGSTISVPKLRLERIRSNGNNTWITRAQIYSMDSDNASIGFTFNANSQNENWVYSSYINENGFFPYTDKAKYLGAHDKRWNGLYVWNIYASNNIVGDTLKSAGGTYGINSKGKVYSTNLYVGSTYNKDSKYHFLSSGEIQCSDIWNRDRRRIYTLYKGPNSSESYHVYGSNEIILRIATKTTEATNSSTRGLSFLIGNGYYAAGSSSTGEISSVSNQIYLAGGNDGNRYLRSYPMYSRTYASAANVYVTNEGTLGRYSSSSVRYKHDVEYLTNEEQSTIEEEKKLQTVPKKRLLAKGKTSTATVLDLPIVNFKYNEGYITGEQDFNYDKPIMGLIAEDVANVLPECATYIEDENGEKIPEAWDINQLVIHMLYTIQQQQKNIEELQSQINSK